MIDVSIATKKEWEAILDKFNIDINSCCTFPFGEYFKTNIYGEDVIFYRGGVRKMNCSASTQYMIDHFDLDKILEFAIKNHFKYSDYIAESVSIKK